jgi:SAM-dependent methyltransferase
MVVLTVTIAAAMMEVKMKEIVKEIAKVSLNSVQGSWASVASTLGIIDFVPPPNSSLRKTSSKTLKHYYISGIRCYLPIATIALHHRVRLNEEISILDFGCGVGRQLMHFMKYYPNAKYFACDVDHTHIDFMCKNYPNATFRVNNFNPPLPFQTSAMDMVYSVTTFSNLCPEDHMPWLKEMCRVTKPGGFCFLTTEGIGALRFMEREFEDLAEGEKQLREAGFLYREYPWLAGERQRRTRIAIANRVVGIEGSYGNTVLTPDYIRRTWPASGFEVVDIIEGIIDHRQDLVTLRKPA